MPAKLLPPLFIAILGSCATHASQSADAGPKSDDTGSQEVEWGLMDVSILYPAGNEHIPHLLGAQNEVEGNTRILLDEEVFDLSGTETFFLTETPNQDQHYEKLRVTSLRLDPCIDGFDPHAATCLRGLRLVLQPIWPLGSDFDVIDASVHVFYELSPTEWTGFLDRYASIRTEDLSELPLGVHPVLSNDMEGPFATALRDLVTEFATSERMVRMTLMATGRSGNNWFWAGFDRDGNAWNKMELLNGFEEDSFTQFGRDAFMSPPSPVHGFPSELLHNESLDVLSDAEVEAALQRVYEIENPTMTNATNVPCAACHIADETRGHVLERRGLMEMDVVERYANSNFDLNAPKSDENIGKNMHAFSYFRQDAPTVSQRVVNESAEVVEALRMNFENRD